MAPKARKSRGNLSLKSIWDEELVEQVFTNRKLRAKMWRWIINHPSIYSESRSYAIERPSDSLGAIEELRQVPFDEWSVAQKSSTALRQQFRLFTSRVVDRQESLRGDSIKLLIELQDGHRVETVLMQHSGHCTVCISSQIGCKMGCRFCATGTMGIIGDLTSAEIIEQVVHANAITKIRNVVFMGMGEPLNNYEHVKRAVEFMIDSNRFALSPRHVTVSTVGVLETMRRLTDELPSVSLALSLHAPNQEVRVKIVPAASAHRLDRLMEAVDYHIAHNKLFFRSNKKRQTSTQSLDRELEQEEESCIGSDASVAIDAAYGQQIGFEALLGSDPGEKTTRDSSTGKRRLSKLSGGVMIEYILIRDVNDREEHAYELAQLLHSRRENVLLNLIPYNPTDVAENYAPPTAESVARFFHICSTAPFEIHTRVRQEKGQDIAGACGQLALAKGSGALPEPTVVLSGNGNAPAKDIEDYYAVSNKFRRKIVLRETTSLPRARGQQGSESKKPSAWLPSICHHLMEKHNRPALLCYMNVSLVLALIGRSVLSKAV